MECVLSRVDPVHQLPFVDLNDTQQNVNKSSVELLQIPFYSKDSNSSQSSYSSLEVTAISILCICGEIDVQQL